jgi:prevent-host-death family protein
MDRTLTASHFKAHCLALLDEVAETGESLLITKHGRPVAHVAPVQAPASLRGSVTLKVSEEELIAPLPEHWDAAGR